MITCSKSVKFSIITDVYLIPFAHSMAGNMYAFPCELIVKKKPANLTEAYRHSIGIPVASLDGITTAFDQDTHIIQVQERSQFVCNTVDVLKDEQHMVDLARAGRGVKSPI